MHVCIFVGEILIKQFLMQVRSVHTMTMDLFIFVNIFFRTKDRREAGTIANNQNFTMIPVKKTLKKTVILNKKSILLWLYIFELIKTNIS